MSVGCGGWVMMPQLRFSDEDLMSMSANAAREVSNPGSRGGSRAAVKTAAQRRRKSAQLGCREARPPVGLFRYSVLRDNAPQVWSLVEQSN